MKKKNILFLTITLVSILIYIFTIYVVFSYKPSYEYSMYYKQKIVKYWSGDNAMTISTDYKMEFDYINNEKNLYQSEVRDVHLQFLGRDFNLKTYDNGGDKLEYICTNNGNLYWQWNSETNFDKIKIQIYLSCSEKFTIEANNQSAVEYDSTNENYDYVIYSLDYANQNKLHFSSEKEIKIKQLVFLEN